jgi:hypothetical protein
MSQMRAIVDKLLSNASQMIKPEGFVADEALPSIDTVQNTGKLGKYGNGHLRILHTLMGGRGEARRVEVITRSSDSFEVEKHGLEGLVTLDDIENVEQPFDAENDEVTGLTTVLQLGKEKALADVMTSTSVMTQNATLSGTAQFSDYANSDPLAKALIAQNAVFDAVGKKVNRIIMPQKVYNTLKYHPAILDALGFKANRAGLLTEQDLARAFDVEKIHIAAAIYNSAKDGQSDSLTSLWGKHMVFYYAPEVAQKYQVSLGYLIKKKRGRKVYKYAINNPPESTGILVQDEYDMVISKPTAGYLFKDVIA